MTDQTETARQLLWRHHLPEDVIDGALCLHAQELAAVQREAISKTDDPVFYEGEAGWLVGLIEPEPEAAAAPAVPAGQTPDTDRADLGTEFVRQAAHPDPDQAGLDAFEADLASETGPKADSKPATGRAGLREQIAAALLARIKQAVVEPPQPPWGQTTSLLAATEYDLADEVLPILAAELEAERAGLRDLLRVENQRANAAIDREETAEQAAEDHRLALSEALGLGTGAPWDAIRDRATELGLPPLSQDPVAWRLGLLAEHRAAVLREEATRIRAHCPDHLDGDSAEGSWINCHCAVADDMLRRLAAVPAVVSAVPGQADGETWGCAQCGHLSCMGKGRRCGVILTSDERVVDPPCPCTGAEQSSAGAQQPKLGRSDVGTEFVRQVDQPDEAGLAAFETDLAKACPPGCIACATDESHDPAPAAGAQQAKEARP